MGPCTRPADEGSRAPVLYSPLLRRTEATPLRMPALLALTLLAFVLAACDSATSN